ncbi:MAG: hypothetical protein JWR59_616 [Brevundimonas sp.]|nr:hypothetical protein [Brevundimonas sp.]
MTHTVQIENPSPEQIAEYDPALVTWAENIMVVTFLETRPLDLCQSDAKRQMRELATAYIERTWPDWKQRNAALGLYGSEGLSACAAFIQSVRDRTDDLDAMIDSAPDAGALQAVPLTFEV